MKFRKPLVEFLSGAAITLFLLGFLDNLPEPVMAWSSEVSWRCIQFLQDVAFEIEQFIAYLVTAAGG